jgi:signal transduction histidine kinase
MTLTLDIPSVPLPVQGNQSRLSQIVSNYVSNAIKYTPAGGEITVNLHARKNEVWFSVIDTGYGIASTAQAQLFQRFYRVPAVVLAAGESGTGLGLSIVKAIVEAYGGRVFVESQAGQGSTFGCVLPAAAE